MKKLLIIALSMLLLAGCAQLAPEPTPTSTPTLTPSVTPTITPTQTPSPTPTKTPRPTPTLTSTPDIVATFTPKLPQEPEGFEWRYVPEVNVFVLIPDGWFFKLEDREELQLKGFYVTRENIDEVGRFSTGFTLFVYEGLGDPAELEQQLIQFTILEADTTKELIDSWAYETSFGIIRHFEIEGEFPYETEANQHKIIHYFTLVYQEKVYYGIFESPKDEWEQAKENFGAPIMDNLAIIGN